MIKSLLTLTICLNIALALSDNIPLQSWVEGSKMDLITEIMEKVTHKLETEYTTTKKLEAEFTTKIELEKELEMLKSELSQKNNEIIRIRRQEACFCTGKPGYKGDKGEAGLKGPRGENGTVGQPGPIGPMGLTGRIGAAGVPGYDGRAGRPGLSGYDGRPGRTGPIGPIGLSGTVGAKGEPGSTGLSGGIGIPGVPGIIGTRGEPGPRGIPGNDGEDVYLNSGYLSSSNLKIGTSGKMCRVCSTTIIIPKSGCDLITESGVCVSYLTSRGSNWTTARNECVEWGGDLATITSSNEDRLFDSIASVRPTECWIGFNDIGREGEWRWADGTESSFTNWERSNPDNYKGHQNCGTKYWKGPKWDDEFCHELKRCYFCSAKVIPFQIKEEASFITAVNGKIYQNATLYCITENKNTPEVTWSYVDLAGRQSVLRSSTTDVTTGVSALTLTTDKPGYYSCQVTQQGGVSKRYGVWLEDPLLLADESRRISSGAHRELSGQIGAPGPPGSPGYCFESIPCCEGCGYY